MHGYKYSIFYAVAVLTLSVASYMSLTLTPFPGLEALIKASPALAALVFLVGSAVLAHLAFPSMPVIYVAAGYYMGGLEGGATVLLGSSLGGLGAFLLYREHVPKAHDRLSQHSPIKIWLTVLGLRLSPIVPAPLVNFFAAIFHVSPLQYTTTTLLGSAPLILFYAHIGQQGHEYMSGNTPQWWLFSGYVIILALSTLLSTMGPWKLFLDEIKKLKNAAVTSLKPYCGTQA